MYIYIYIFVVYLYMYIYIYMTVCTCIYIYIYAYIYTYVYHLTVFNTAPLVRKSKRDPSFDNPPIWGFPKLGDPNIVS